MSAPGKRITRLTSVCVENIVNQPRLRGGKMESKAGKMPARRENRSISLCIEPANNQSKMHSKRKQPPAVAARNVSNESIPAKRAKRSVSVIEMQGDRSLEQVTSIADNLCQVNFRLTNEVKSLKDLVLKKDSDVIRAYERLFVVQQTCERLKEQLQEKESQIVTLKAAEKSYKVDAFGADLIMIAEGNNKIVNLLLDYLFHLPSNCRF